VRREGLQIDILHLVDRLEALLNAGWRIPFTSKAVIDERRCLDIIDQMRVAIPEEITQAKRVSQDRDRIIDQAKAEAERIVDQGREQANFIMQDRGLLKTAEEKSQAIVEEARVKARETQAGADDYALDTLTTLESELGKIMAQVQHGLDILSKGKGARSGPPETPPAPR
jgi:cell division septum initiation protein DivIVA